MNYSCLGQFIEDIVSSGVAYREQKPGAITFLRISKHVYKGFLKKDWKSRIPFRRSISLHIGCFNA